MAKSNLQVPAKNSRNHTILGKRGNTLKWYTQAGWDLIPDELRYKPDGTKIRVKKGGWEKVNPEDFEPAPGELNPADVVPPADPNTGTDPNPGKGGKNDPKKVVETTGKKADEKPAE